MLTLLHTSDWHLGHELNSHNREGEHEAFLDWLLTEIGTQSADVLLVTGDIYDVANPPIAAMRRLFAFLHAATTRYKRLHIILLGGNHDSAGRIDLPAALLGETRVHCIGALPRRDGAPDIARLLIPLPGPSGAPEALLAAIPFCRPADLGAHTLPSLYAAITQAAVERAGALPLVLTGHLHVAGGAISDLSERRITIGGEEAQAATLFDARAAYVALGHLHRPQAISGETTIRYAGSPFPLSTAERTYHHSIARVSLRPGACDVALIPIPRPVDFLAIGPAPLDDVVAQIEALNLPDLPPSQHPFIDIAVRLDGPEPHLQARILAALAEKPLRLVRIQSIRAAAPAADPLAGADLAELDPQTVFAALHQSRHGTDPAPDLARAFAQLLIEAQTAQGNT